MKRLLLCTLLSITVSASAVPMIIAPPERRIYVMPNGDKLEWQPGLGIVVLAKGRTQTHTRVSKRSDGKAVIQVERNIRVDPAGVGRATPIEPRRARNRADDEGESLMEEVEKPEIIPR